MVERLVGCKSEEEALKQIDTTPTMVFLPAFLGKAHKLSWWYLPPSVVQEFLKVLGFEDLQFSVHTQWSNIEGEVWFYTIVGQRTREVIK